MKIKISKGAFSLIELMIAVSILSMMASTLYHFFYSGKQVYKRLQRRETKEKTQEMFFRVLKRDLHNIIQWQDRTMVLQASNLYFHVADTSEMGKISRIDYQLKKRYQGNSVLWDLKRSETPYPYEEDDSKPSSEMIFLKGMETFDFQLLANISNTTNNSENNATEDKQELPPEQANKKKQPQESKEEDSDNESTEDEEEALQLHWFSEWKHKEPPLALRIHLELPLQEKNSWLYWLPEGRHVFLKDAPKVTLSEEERDDLEESTL